MKAVKRISMYISFILMSLTIWGQSHGTYEPIPVGSPGPQLYPTSILDEGQTDTRRLQYNLVGDSKPYNEYSFMVKQRLEIIFKFSDFSYIRSFGEPLPTNDFSLVFKFNKVNGNNSEYIKSIYYDIKGSTSISEETTLPLLSNEITLPKTTNQSVILSPNVIYVLTFQGIAFTAHVDTTFLPIKVAPRTSIMPYPAYYVTMILSTRKAPPTKEELANIPEASLPNIPTPHPAITVSLPSSPEHNSVCQFESNNGSADQGILTTNYYDDFGREEQTVVGKFTPLGKDMVTLSEYDGWGRKSISWLPVVTNQSNGNYVATNKYKDYAMQTYMGDTHPFTTTVYEKSPLEKILKQYSPGADWRTQNKKSSFSYLTNVFGNDSLNCFYYEITDNPDHSMKVTAVSSYATGKLSVIRMENEDGSAFFEFKDISGKTLLIRHVDYTTTGKRFYDTYYLYDELGYKSAVLPPELSERTFINTSIESDLIDKYAYLYQYDAGYRMIAQKIPGADWIYHIYDNTDRPVFTQTGEQRKTNEWSFTFYDPLGRPCITGTCKKIFNVFNNPLKNTSATCTYLGKGAGTYGYSFPDFSLTEQTIHSVNYYDRYHFLTAGFYPSGLDSAFNYVPEPSYGKKYVNAKGLLTGTITRHLNDIKNSWSYTTFYYDDQNRIIQTRGTNQLGGSEEEYIAYNFTGQPVRSKHVHSVPGKVKQIELYSYEYDSSGRLLKKKHQLNDGIETTLIDNYYNELGQLSSNKRNGQSVLQSDYTYNIRSWIKTISGPLFNQTLYYNDRRNDASNRPCYSGNISGIDWKISAINDSKIRGYNFSYDHLSRLMSADYQEDNIRNDKFSSSYKYDKHGNILSLVRYGNLGTNTYGLIDSLTLTYHGNQLVAIEDSAPTPSLSMSMDFKDGAHEELEYAYDQNGNQTKDLNKGINNINYNILNLPQRITFNGQNNPVIEYVYSVEGKKLSVIHKSSTEKRTDYVGNMIYENGSLKRILVDGGYIENGKYYFYLKDHLGNNRVVAKSDGTVVQTNHYYPYGMSFAEGTFADKQPYKYNGKELDTENGLNLYDYDARQMETTLGRFTSVDPLAEKYYAISPYVYCANNPVNRIDPNGCDWYQSTDENKYIWREGHKDIDGYTRLGSSMSFQIGEDSYLNYYQNAGIKANKAVNAFDLISSSGKLQNTLLGKNSILSDESKGELFNALNSRAIDEIARPIGETLVEYGIGTALGGMLGKAVGYVGGKIAGKAVVEGGMRVEQNFGKLGTIVENPGLGLTSFSKHGLNQAITRGVNPSTIVNTVKNPIVVLQQSRGNYLFLTREAAVVTNNAGKIVSTYPASMFDASILNVLK